MSCQLSAISYLGAQYLLRVLHKINLTAVVLKINPLILAPSFLIIWCFLFRASKNLGIDSDMDVEI